jgi:hypothetical protein
MYVVEPCSYAQAKQAVTDWHYSHSYPAGTSHRYGVWEDNTFIGAILFGTGANPNIGKQYSLGQLEVRELTRVALKDGHATHVTQLAADAIRQLRADKPDYRLIISYADSNQGHRGSIYMAGNWLYVGTSAARMLMVNDKLIHPRMAYDVWGTSSLVWLRANVDPTAHETAKLPKHKYVMPLDKAMRRKILKLALAYPDLELQPAA